MSIRRASNNFGLSTNVELNPASSSTSAPTINNNIVIGDPKSDNNENKEYPNVNTAMINAIANLNPYKSDTVDSLNPRGFFAKQKDVQTRDFQLQPSEFTFPQKEDLHNKLLGIYTDILLTNYKLLLANIVSNQQILLTKNNLEDIISTQLNKECEIILKLQQANCISKISPFESIDSIKIKDNDSVVDYKHKFNAEYNILKDNYHISLKYVY